MAREAMDKDERDGTILEMFDPDKSAAPAAPKPAAKKWEVVSTEPVVEPAAKKWEVVSTEPLSSAADTSPTGLVESVKKYADPVAQMLPGAGAFVRPSDVTRGFMQSGVGIDQLLNQLGIGGSIGMPNKEALAAEQKKLEESGRGTGARGVVGELAGNPISWLPGGELGPVVRGATQGGIMGLLSPTADPTQTLVGRGERGAAGAAGGAVLGKTLPYLSEAITHPIATGGKVLDAAQKVAGKVLRPLVQPAAREALLSANPIFGGGLNKALISPTAEEGARLSDKLGVKFSAGELTGNTAARGGHRVGGHWPRPAAT